MPATDRHSKLRIKIPRTCRPVSVVPTHTLHRNSREGAMCSVFRGCRTLMAAAEKTVAAKAGLAKAGATKPVLRKAGAKAAVTTPDAKTSAAKTNLGILKVVPVSPAMREFLGVPEISRTGAVKKIWEYIKLNQLQNPGNKKEICCDEKLKKIFDGKDKVGMMEIARFLTPHFLKPN